MNTVSKSLQFFNVKYIWLHHSLALSMSILIIDLNLNFPHWSTYILVCIFNDFKVKSKFQNNYTYIYNNMYENTYEDSHYSIIIFLSSWPSSLWTGIFNSKLLHGALCFLNMNKYFYQSFIGFFFCCQGTQLHILIEFIIIIFELVDIWTF